MFPVAAIQSAVSRPQHLLFHSIPSNVPRFSHMLNCAADGKDDDYHGHAGVGGRGNLINYNHMSFVC